MATWRGWGWRWRCVGGRHVDCCLYCLCLRVSAPRHPRNLRGPASASACTASTVPGTLRAGDHNLAAALSGRPPSPRTTCRTDPAASQRYQVVTRVAELFNFDINSVLQIQYSKSVKSAFPFEELSDTITNRHLTSCLNL